MSRILFLTQVLPYPLDSGAKIRAYYVLRHLSVKHEVTLVSFVRADDSAHQVVHLERLCRAVHTVSMKRARWRDIRALLVAGLTRQPAIIVRDQIGAMRSLLRHLVESQLFDVVHADQTSMAQYASYAVSQAARSAVAPPPMLVLDAHNALYRIPLRMAESQRNPLKRWALRHEALALERYEKDVCSRFDHVVFVADQDRQALRASGPVRDSTVIPICIDTQNNRMVQRVPQPRTITHLGTMFWPPNVDGVHWFAEEVWPLVVGRVDGVRLVVAGKNPPEEIARLGRHDRKVDVVGYVPDPASILAQTAAFVVPLRSAAGMRVKILDAWCWGVPVVSTSMGAEGINYRSGETLLVADSAEEFAEAVVRLLREPRLGEQLRENGRRWVTEHYDWHIVYASWDDVYGSRREV